MLNLLLFSLSRKVFDVYPFTVAIDRVTLLESFLTFAVVGIVLLKCNLTLFL